MEKPKIAWVDDEPDILENYQELFSDIYDILTYPTPEDFLESLKDKNKIPSVLITDLKMPKIDGLTLVQKAYAISDSFPVVLLTGFLEKQVMIDAVDIGVYRILEKPIDRNVLASAIDQLLIEHDIYTVRQDIRQITAQLREIYSSIRLVMDQYIPPEIKERFIVDAPEGTITKHQSFDQLLESLENRLETLLNSEKLLTELRLNKFKSKIL